MTERSYDALLLDLDGTLLDAEGRIRPANREAVLAAEAEGVRVMVVTGRSCISALPVLDELALDTPAVVFNGAAVWCPRTRRLLEERTLSSRALEQGLAFGARGDYMTVAMCASTKYALSPRSESERVALSYMTSLRFVPRERLRVDHTIRLTYFSDRHASDLDFARDVEAAIDQPVYLTWFPLEALPYHRESPLQVVDVHPPCRGKAEAVRVLEELYGIPSERMVAVGDASNDVPMFERVGLSVSMAGGMECAREAADRVIGGHETDAIAELVGELFLDGRRASVRAVSPAS